MPVTPQCHRAAVNPKPDARKIVVRTALIALLALPVAIAMPMMRLPKLIPRWCVQKNLARFRRQGARRRLRHHQLCAVADWVNYKFGGNTPEQGSRLQRFDRYVFQQATGIALPRTAREQARVGETVAIDKLQPGDLVFFNTRRFQFSHVGLYLGDNRFIHARAVAVPVEVVSLEQKYWQKPSTAPAASSVAFRT